MHCERQLRLIEPIPRERCIPAMEHGQHQAWVESSRAAAAARAAVRSVGRSMVWHLAFQFLTSFPLPHLSAVAELFPASFCLPLLVDHA